MNRIKTIHSFARGIGSLLEISPRPKTAERVSVRPVYRYVGVMRPTSEDAIRVQLSAVCAWLQLLIEHPELRQIEPRAAEAIESLLDRFDVAPSPEVISVTVAGRSVDAAKIATDQTRVRRRQIELARKRLRALQKSEMVAEDSE